MKKKTTLCDLYYIRNLISLIIIIAFLDKNKNKNKKILYINRNKTKNFARHINKKIIFLLKDFFKSYFDEIHYIDYSRNIKPRGNIFERILQRSKNIKFHEKKINLKIRNNYKVANIYAGGDDFENVVLKKINHFPKFHFIEHGYGPLRDSIFFKVRLKHIFFTYIFKIPSCIAHLILLGVVLYGTSSSLLYSNSCK